MSDKSSREIDQVYVENIQNIIYSSFYKKVTSVEKQPNEKNEILMLINIPNSC